MATPFEVDSGTMQGRSPAGAGSAFELGHRNQLLVNLAAGDRQAVEQSYVLPDQVALIRFQAVVSVPDVPAGSSWVFTARLNGTAHYTRTLEPGKVHTITDGAFRLSSALASPAPNAVQFRLELA